MLEDIMLTVFLTSLVWLVILLPIMVIAHCDTGSQVVYCQTHCKYDYTEIVEIAGKDYCVCNEKELILIEK